MQKDLHLFIGGEEVEFKQNPAILYNYTLTDITNPTTVKNSFSKAIEIPSTPANDNIFNHFWNLERYQTDSLSFNPMEQVPFELYYEGALIERGYAKLNSVKKANHAGTYSINLFGGLGTFFYNLNYQGSSNNKKSLANLYYVSDNIRTEPDLDFRINKDAIAEAWEGGYIGTNANDRWNVINFVPAYNGLPGDFDNSKALINYNGLESDLFVSARTDSGTRYATRNGYSLAEGSEMTEWETFDLRSYLQRPAVSVKRTLQACFAAENNGGYEVKLDSHFFNTDNPYWTDGWMTLPMLRDLEIKGGETETIYGGSLNYSGHTFWTKYYTLNHTAPTLSSVNNAQVKMQLAFSPSGSVSSSTLYGWRWLDVNTGLHIFNGHTYVKNFKQNTGVVVQLQALNSQGAVVAASDAYLLATFEDYPDKPKPLYEKFDDEDGLETNYHYISGVWSRSGSNFIFTDNAGQPVTISFNLNRDSNFSSLRIKMMCPSARYIKYAWSGNQSVLDAPTTDNAYSPLYTSRKSTVSGDYTSQEAQALDRVMGNFNFRITSMSVSATDYSQLFSDTLIPKNKILATSFSPGEFLLSWAKMFGLYFYYDASEVSADQERYPSGVIHIMDRDTFYDGEHIDITDRIDRGKDMSITPTNAESKWYEFKQEQADSEAATLYENNYGHTYGRQLVNTNFNFNADTKNLYDGNVFKAGIMVMENGKYYTAPINGLPYWVFNGFSYQLYNGENTLEIDIPVERPRRYNLNTLGYKDYDMLPRLQCHIEENSPSDGSGILVFFKGFAPTHSENGTVSYWLTDDIQEMADLNGGAPCWILTNSEYDSNSKKIANEVTSLPIFTRDLINFGLTTGYITHSWNFGHPEVTYVPETYTTSGDSIYDKWWKNYINDLYSVNSKTVSCYVRLPRYAHPSLLRKWWHFDNGIWILNSIKDWQVDKDIPVLCEFIKVQDTANYALDRIQPIGQESIVLDSPRIGCSGGTITGTVYLQSGGQWFANDFASITGRDSSGNTITQPNAIYPASGSGQSSRIYIRIPANASTSPISWTIKVQDDYDNYLSVSLNQATCAATGGTIKWLNRAPETASGSTDITLYFVATGFTDANIGAYAEEDWLRASVNAASRSVTFTFTANPYAEARSSEIVVNGIDDWGHYQSDRVILTQAAGNVTINVAPTALTFEYLHSQAYSLPQTINVSATTTWNAAVTGDFVISPSTGTGSTVVSAWTAGVNSGVTEKTGSIVFTSGSDSKTVQLRQRAIPHTDPLITLITNDCQAQQGLPYTQEFTIVNDSNTQMVRFSGISQYDYIHIYNNNTQQEVTENELLWKEDTDGVTFTIQVSCGQATEVSIYLVHYYNDSGTYTKAPYYQTIVVDSF